MSLKVAMPSIGPAGRRGIAGSAGACLVLHTFDGEDMDDAVLYVYYSRNLDSFSFVGERRARVVEFIVGLSCIVVQCEMIAIRHIAVPRKGLVFPFHNPGECLRLSLFPGTLACGLLLFWTFIFFFCGCLAILDH